MLVTQCFENLNRVFNCEQCKEIRLRYLYEPRSPRGLLY